MDLTYFKNLPWYYFVIIGIGVISYFYSKISGRKKEAMNYYNRGRVESPINYREQIQAKKAKEPIIDEAIEDKSQIFVNHKAIDEVSDYAEVAFKKLSKRRAQTKLFRNVMWLLSGGVFLALLYSYLFNFGNFLDFEIIKYNQNNYYYYLIAILVIFGLISLSSKYYVRFLSKYMQEENGIITFLVEKLFPGLNFNPEHKVSRKLLSDSRLFSGINDSIKPLSYGFMSGRHFGVTLNITDIGIVEADTISKISSVIERIPVINLFLILYKYVFKSLFAKQISNSVLYTYRGLFCWAKFNKKLSGNTFVIPNNIGSKFNKSLQFTFTEEEKIRLEDPRFSDDFIVYATDQVEARYILTSSLMEKISEFRRNNKQPIMLSFVGDTIYIAAENSEGLFTSSANAKKAADMVNQLVSGVNTALSVVEDFRLNKHTAFTELGKGETIVTI